MMVGSAMLFLYEAYRRGYRAIVVIRTIPSEYQYSKWVERMGK